MFGNNPITGLQLLTVQRLGVNCPSSYSEPVVISLGVDTENIIGQQACLSSIYQELLPSDDTEADCSKVFQHVDWSPHCHDMPDMLSL